MKKSMYVAPVLALALVAGAGVVGLTHTHAADTSTGKTLVQKIAEKFNLKESDVQTVFDQDRTDHEAEMKQAMADRLTQAVTDGKITADQKQKILDKQQELRTQMEANRDSFKTMTEAERRAAMEKQRTDLEQWAKDNGIDPQYLMFAVYFKGGPGGPDRGFGLMMKDGGAPSTFSTTTN
jgi:hypothetical protein